MPFKLLLLTFCIDSAKQMGTKYVVFLPQAVDKVLKDSALSNCLLCVVTTLVHPLS